MNYKKSLNILKVKLNSSIIFYQISDQYKPVYNKI